MDVDKISDMKELLKRFLKNPVYVVLAVLVIWSSLLTILLWNDLSTGWVFFVGFVLGVIFG